MTHITLAAILAIFTLFPLLTSVMTRVRPSVEVQNHRLIKGFRWLGLSLDIIVPAGGNVQAAIDLSQCNDSIFNKASNSYLGNLRLRNKGCELTVDPITITTEGFSVPANRRVVPADDSSMARILAPGTNGMPVIESDAGAGGYKLIGLYLSVNYGSDPNKKYHSTELIKFHNGNDANPAYGQWLAHDIMIDRCHLAGKFGDARFALSLHGKNLSVRNSRIDEFATASGADSAGLWTANGPGPITLENNYISAGMWNIFAGGADSDSPNRGKVTSASVSEVTLSNLEGELPKVGDLIAFYTRPPGGESTWQPNTPYPLGTLQFHHTNWTREAQKPPLLFHVVQGGVSGNTEPNWSALNEYDNKTTVDGSVTWKLFNGDWQVGEVTKIASTQTGITVSIAPKGPTGIFLPPIVGSTAKWNGYSPSIISRRNHYVRPSHWANFNAPNKGMVQIKNSSNSLFEGDFWDVEPGNSPNEEFNRNHRPGLFNLTPGNQSYSAPWSTARNITFRYSRARNVESVFNWALSDYVKTNLPGGNITAHDNLFQDVWHGFLVQCNGGFNVAVKRNTVINQSEQPIKLFGDKINGLVYEDNIVGWYQGPFLEFGDKFLQNVTGASSEKNNVFVDVNNRTAEGYPPTFYFPNSLVARTWAELKLQADGRLASDSPFKGRGTDGKDPGADISLIEAAIGGTPSAPSPTPTPSATSTPTPTPTSTPTPSPSVTPTPIGSRSIEGYLKVNEQYFQQVAVVTVTHANAATQSFTTQPGGHFFFSSVLIGSVITASGSGYTFGPVTVDSSPYFILHGVPVPGPSPSVAPTPTPSPTATPTPVPSPSPSPRCVRFNRQGKCTKWL